MLYLPKYALTVTAEYTGAIPHGGSKQYMLTYLFDGSYVDKDPSYFEDTHRSTVNDVVHAKLTGTKIGKRDGLYPSFVNYSGTKYLLTRISGLRRSANTAVSGFSRPGCFIGVSVVKYASGPNHFAAKGMIITNAYKSGNYYYVRYGTMTMEFKWSEGRAVIDTIKLSNFDSELEPIVKAYTLGIKYRIISWLYEPGKIIDFDDLTILADHWAFGLEDAILDYDTRFRTQSTRFSSSYVKRVTSVAEVQCKDAFLFHEDDLFTKSLVSVARNDFSMYWKNYLEQHAWLDAIQSMPTLSDNAISNVIELVSFIKGLVVDHQVEIPKSLSDAWLSYRYVYTTTKLDAEEAIKFVSRMMDLGSFDRPLEIHGKANIDYNGVNVTCRATAIVKPKELGTLGKIWRSLERYGLTPDFYVIWDSIPYSFIVDWFLPISNVLTVADAKLAYSTDKYEYDNIMFSLSYVREDVGYYPISCYYRYLSSVPELNGLFFIDGPSASTKTVAFRALDALSIIVGH